MRTSILLCPIFAEKFAAIYLSSIVDMMQFSEKMRRSFNIFLSALVVAAFVGVGEVSAQDGEKLFKANCSSCHKVDQNMTGPALQGVEERWAGNEELLYLWIKNPNAALETGDSYVKNLYNEWFPKGGLMPGQAVNDEEITAILAYVKNWVPPVRETPVDGDALADIPVERGLDTTWLLIVLFILLILVFSLWSVRTSLNNIQNAMRASEGTEIEAEMSFATKAKIWFLKNKVFVSILSILFVVYLAVSGYEALMGIGVYQGYTPEQPIAFNHTLHAGENGVACVYCHTGALKSKHAGIPSANICMNCHKGINRGRNDEGTAEIMKIYEAVGWDMDNQEYTGEEKPIKWVKVHNLPDHAYFNHAQHYVVGEIECQECHGEIQKDYTVAGQYAPLTMGWCINCHLETEVKMEGNEYYDEIHERLKENGKEELKKYLEDGTITAKELGGWECAKCHY
ncbi:MAG: mono/diheme cytochrome c family protein [Cryomorphaceae bacterium]|jgi:mono/diheme cytochrome c family protein